MELQVGDIVQLSTIKPIMTEQNFQKLLEGKSQNTTIPYMQKAKHFIVRGLLTRGTDRKAVSDHKEIIGGAYTPERGKAEGRIFLSDKEKNNAELLWKGPLRESRENYRKIRDKLADKVPYKLHGRAASKTGKGL
jgi:hypothetical protein